VVWKAQEQQVLSYLLRSVSRDILVQIVALPTAADVWKHLETSFASQSRARVINTRMALATTQKGSSSAAEYVSKMKTLADEMASAGKKLDDEELISYILVGLDYEYNSLVSSIAARVEPVILGDMYSQLLAFETHLELQNGAQTHAAGLPVPPPHASVNSASCGRGGFSRGRSGRNSRGSLGAGGRGRGDPYKLRNKFPPCQLCGKTNHPVFKCFKRFDPSYMGDERSANTATSYGVDSNWYADSGATDHVTKELDKLAVRDAYNGIDQIFILISFLLRIGNPGKLFFKASLEEGFILFFAALQQLRPNKSSTSARSLLLDGMPVLVIHL
jgi:hypothetical protein